MRKFVSVLVIFLFLFLGCAFNPEYLMKDYEIVNNASIDVSFILKNYDETVYNLAIGKSLTKYMYGSPKFQFVGSPRVFYKSGADACQILDMPSWTVQFYNSGLKKVIISEKNNMLGIYGEKIEINSNETVTSKIYINDPDFSIFYSDNNMPVSNLKAEWENNIYKVTVN